jgi:2-polyprenyl-3-methyl-5-hydroxy-6-metoxy-1,4-benzoquinol methylase
MLKIELLQFINFVKLIYMKSTDKYPHLYNQSYQFITPEFLCVSNLSRVDKYLDLNNQSLVKFSKSYFSSIGGEAFLNGKSILETGCGIGGMSQYFSTICDDVTGIDISTLAIAGAHEICKLKNTSIHFRVADLSQPELELGRKFDIIFDSHLLHCLTNVEQRKNYLTFVKNHLNPGGIFMVETMILNKEMQEPLGYELSDDFVLSKVIDDIKTPIRSVYPSLMIEDEIKEHLCLNYFYVHNELNFEIFNDIENYPSFRLPKTVRLCATFNG